MEKFVRAMEKGNEYANSHPEEVRKIDAEMTEMPADYIESREIPPLSSEVHTSAIEAFAQAMEDQGLLETAPTVDDLVWSGAPRVD